MKKQKLLHFQHTLMDEINPNNINEVYMLDVFITDGCGRNHVVVMVNNNFRDKDIAFEVDGATHTTMGTLYPPFTMDIDTGEVDHTVGNPTEHFLFDLFLERDVGSFKIKSDGKILYALTWAYGENEWSLLDTENNKVSLNDDDEVALIPARFTRYKKVRDVQISENEKAIGGVRMNLNMQ